MATPAVPMPMDPQLTAVANAISNEAFISDDVLPVIEVDQQAFAYLEIPRGQFFQTAETLIGPLGEPNEVNFVGNRQTGATDDHALMGRVSNRIQQQVSRPGNTTGFDPRAVTTEGVRDLILLGKEIDMATKVFDPNNYPAANKQTLSGTSQWSDATSDPSRAVLTIMDGMIMRPNIMVIGQAVATAFRLHAGLLKAYNGDTGRQGVVDLAWLAGYMGLERILVGGAWRTTNKMGAADVYTRVWGKHAALLHRSTRQFFQADGTRVVVSWGCTFVFPVNGQRYATFTWDDPRPGVNGAENIKVSTSYTHKVIANDFGYLFINAVA